MKALIEEYRGFEIFFDTYEEKFYTKSNEHDVQQAKSSYASVKKWIDDFIKNNTEFKPFLIESINYYSNEKLKIIGIRKDGRFVYENNGQKQQLPEYSEKEYIVYNPENEKHWEKYNEIKNKQQALREEEKQVLSLITGISLSEVRKKYTENGN
jgi:hypothetical protein